MTQGLVLSAVAAAPSAQQIRAAVAHGHDLQRPLDPIDVGPRLASAQELVAEASKRPDPSNDRPNENEGDPPVAFDALLITDLLNIRALTGFTGSAAKLLLSAERAVLVTDFRYAERAVDELRNANCAAEIVVERTVTEQRARIETQLLEQAVDRLGLESAHVSWTELRAFDAAFSAQLVPAPPLVEILRRTKTGPELQRIARASRIADEAFRSVLHLLNSRCTERAFANALENAMRACGADGISFASIIASGPNASRPHHEPGSRIIEAGDLVICDFGALVDGYHSDTTRTVSMGEPSQEQRQHLDAVLRSQSAGIALVRPGALGVDVDAACRASLAEVGWEQFLTTGTGHGTGLQIHESPWLGTNSRSELAEGDITTVEPGVYLPAVAGVRFEDSLVVASDGPVFLTTLPYEIVVG